MIFSIVKSTKVATTKDWGRVKLTAFRSLDDKQISIRNNFFLSLCRLRRFPSLFYAPLALSACDVGLWDCDKWQLISCHFLRVSRPCLPKQIQFHLFKVFFSFLKRCYFSPFMPTIHDKML